MSDSNGDSPDSPRSNGDPERALFHREADPVLEHLSSHHRRTILLLLKEDEIDTLADVLRYERAEPTMTETELLHCHLPKLQDANYVEFDPTTGALSKGPRFDRAVSLLELMAQHADELPPNWP